MQNFCSTISNLDSKLNFAIVIQGVPENFQYFAFLLRLVIRKLAGTKTADFIQCNNVDLSKAKHKAHGWVAVSGGKNNIFLCITL